MSEVRLAKAGETARQKEIWKLCFGDSDHYIDFYYANRYKEDETLLLLQDGEILAMLTMLPIKTIAADKRSFNSTMLYAIATHPKYQSRGYATQIMNFAYHYLRKKTNAFSILVPSEKQLFDFYRQQGYQDGFYIREASFTWNLIESWDVSETWHCTISGITPEEYNHRRNKQLSGRLYVSYADEEITYQKMLSQQFGADIYGIEIEEVQGCVVIEKMNSDKVFIKEILIPEELLPVAVKYIAKLFHAKEYILRTPAFLGKQLQGSIRPFGIIRANQEIDLEITPEDLGYLGFAFD
ncbi:MAG: GNAT family N-acetyltransferase [Firmicutes bacterium HGW-Firmicutes-15]|nr:MAG: GNAT family N-acetyltransferase [Firmicutes bacterium HGW-Firmicutes-15]